MTDLPGRDFAVVGAGLNMLPAHRFALQLNYNAEVGRARATAHLANALLLWEF